jgi:hypothetical protein
MSLGWQSAPPVIALMARDMLAQQGVALVFVLALVGTVLLRYRASHSPSHRRKVRWAVFGAFISGIGGLLIWFLPVVVIGRPLSNANVLGLLSLPFPVTLAIAILRHHLFDIDVIINRALIYTVLTLTLALAYFASVVFLQALQSLVFHTEPNELVTVLSTLLIAALFAPLRSRIQTSIDRRFYRQKYDAIQTLQAFAVSLRDEVDLNQLSERLLDVVEETMQPERVSLWLKRTT